MAHHFMFLFKQTVIRIVRKKSILKSLRTVPTFVNAHMHLLCITQGMGEFTLTQSTTLPRVLSIMPKISEILVGNQMERFVSVSSDRKIRKWKWST